MGKPHMLKGLVVDEISLVDHPANIGSVVVLAKRLDQEKEIEMTTFSEVMKERDQTLIRVAKHYPSAAGLAAFPTLTAADFIETLKRYALDNQRTGETPEQAFSRVLKTTDTGRALRQAALWAPGADHRSVADAMTKRESGPASQLIHDKAQALLLNEAGSRAATGINPVTRAGLLASAKTRIRRAHPDLAAAEAREQRGG